MFPQHDDRRRHIRQSVRIPARVVLGDGSKRVDAMIVNISKVGAMLCLEHVEELTDTFYMLFGDHSLQPCQLVWRTQLFAGVCYPDCILT
jgi:hypothetical protein